MKEGAAHKSFVLLRRLRSSMVVKYYRDCLRNNSPTAEGLKEIDQLLPELWKLSLTLADSIKAVKDLKSAPE